VQWGERVKGRVKGRICGRCRILLSLLLAFGLLLVVYYSFQVVVSVAVFSAMVRGMFTIFVMIPKPESMVLRLFMSVRAGTFKY